MLMLVLTDGWMDKILTTYRTIIHIQTSYKHPVIIID